MRVGNLADTPVVLQLGPQIIPLGMAGAELAESWRGEQAGAVRAARTEFVY